MGVEGSNHAPRILSIEEPPEQRLRAQMKAAGMVPLTVNAADMKALVGYVNSLQER
jgi:hypothetical protein